MPRLGHPFLPQFPRHANPEKPKKRPDREKRYENRIVRAFNNFVKSGRMRP